MIYEKIPFDGENEKVYLEVYAADKVGDFKRKALLVIPGGGYNAVCSDREGEPIAMAFMPYGYNAFVLHYSVAKSKKFPSQLIEASAAVKYIKDNAEKYNIDKNNVFAVGFSAGGHLAASLGTLWHKDEIYESLKMEYGYNKPNGVMLIYPVITAFGEECHEESIENLMCEKNPPKEKRMLCSIEKNIDEKTTPAFIVHTANDDFVSVKNSLVLAEAYTKKNIPYEMHIYPDAPHGVALGNKITAGGCIKHDNPHIAEWIRIAAEWAEQLID